MTMNNPSAATSVKDSSQTKADRPLIVAGFVLGLGQGGFFDGIIFHQLLQWHHMFSGVATDATVSGLELNTIGDGLFHLLDWILTLIGIFLLWWAGLQRKTSWSGRVLLGAILIGAGAFNLVEGVIDHHLFGIHHLKPGTNQLLWDLGFLGAGIVLAIVGWGLIRSDRVSDLD
jgi:uncharacterized membrane protein